MKRLSFRLCLPVACALVLAACQSGPPPDPRADVRAADAAAARALAATAPPDSDAAALQPWLDAQRARMEGERRVAVQRFEADEKACWQRFAVNACVRQARVQRRGVLDRLRQEELAVNEVERQRRTAARLRQLQDKQTPKSTAQP